MADVFKNNETGKGFTVVSGVYGVRFINAGVRRTVYDKGEAPATGVTNRD